MYKKLFASLLCITTAFLCAQQGPNRFDDVIEIGNFFERQLDTKKRTEPNAGILFYDYDVITRNTLSSAGILHSIAPVKSYQRFPKQINTIHALKNIDLHKKMMHEISVSKYALIKGLEELYAPAKVKNKEELAHAFECMEKDQREKFIYYRYLKHVIASLQDKEVDEQVGQQLIQFADLNKDKSFIKKRCMSLKKLASSVRSHVEQMNISHFAKYLFISFMMYKILL